MRRTVELERGWYKEAVGAMLGMKKSDHSIVAFIPTGFSGYSYRDISTGKMVRIGKRNEGEFEEEAIAFYKSFPTRKMDLKDLSAFMLQSLSGSDLFCAALASFAAVVIGVLLPALNQVIFSDVIVSKSINLLLAITFSLVCVKLSMTLMETIKELLMARINTKMSVSVQAATMSRLLSLPAGFFKDYGAGELSSRIQYINVLSSMLVNVLLQTSLTSAFSLVYISQILVYAKSLAAAALMVVLLTTVVSAISTLIQMSISRRQMLLSTKESGMSFALISGVQKIRLSGLNGRH